MFITKAISPDNPGVSLRGDKNQIMWHTGGISNIKKKISELNLNKALPNWLDARGPSLESRNQGEP